MSVLYPPAYHDPEALRAVFSWQTRVELAPKFGALPIGYYQLDQTHAADEIVRRIAKVMHSTHMPVRVRVRAGEVQFQSLSLGGPWYGIGTVRDVREIVYVTTSKPMPDSPEQWTPREPGMCAVCGDPEGQDSRGWVTYKTARTHAYGGRDHDFVFKPQQETGR